jgi:ankyrin repeat protein
MGELHELVECHDWEGIVQLLAHQGSDKERRDLASEEDDEGHLALHYPEIYQPGAMLEAIEAIVDAYPGALTQAKSSLNESEIYPLHVALETMLENQDQEDSEDASYEAYYRAVIEMLLHRAPHVAQYRTHQGLLPLHFAAQLNITGFVELVLSAYPQGACTSTEHLSYALPLHLACQSSKSVGSISHLLQEYPAAAQFKDWVAIEDEEEEYGEDQMENDTLKDDLVPSGYPLHHLCTNMDFWASSTKDASSKERLLIQLYQAHPEAAAYVDHMGRTPLSLLCENICSFRDMEAYISLLNDQSGHSAPATAADCQGRLPLHYLAEKVASAIISCQHERHSLLAFDPSDLIHAWKCLVTTHPQALFYKDHQKHTPLSLMLLLTKKSGLLDMHTRGSGVMHIVLHASFACCMPPPAEDFMIPLSHLLAFFAGALYPAKLEFMDALKQSVAQDASVVDSQGNTMLHIACIGVHWETQEYHGCTALVNATSQHGAEGSLLSAAVSVSNSECFTSPEKVVSKNRIPHEVVAESNQLPFLEFVMSTGEIHLAQTPNHKGQLPLHILLSGLARVESTNANTQVTQEAARLLFRAYPESASIPDPIMHLAPFMASAAATGALATSFELLQSFVASTNLFEFYTQQHTSAYIALCGPPGIKRGSCDSNNSYMSMSKSECRRAYSKRQKRISISF